MDVDSQDSEGTHDPSHEDSKTLLHNLENVIARHVEAASLQSEAKVQSENDVDHKVNSGAAAMQNQMLMSRN